MPTATTSKFDQAVALLLRNQLERRWPSGEDAFASICHYAVSSPGKLVRPTLLLESARAVGANIERLLPAAVGVEIAHVASLIHDDIIDADETRRGRPSVHHRYGIDNAIVAGDALIFDLFLGFIECRRAGLAADRILVAMEIMARCGIDLCRGQNLESEMTKRGSCDADKYFRMIELKTAALFSACCKCGAVLGGGTEEWVEALGAYGHHIGMAFQIRDDELPYISNDETVGKPSTSDITNRRVPLPIILAYERSDRTGRKLLDDALAGRINPAEAVIAVGDLLERTGVLANMNDLAQQHSFSAKKSLELLPSTASRDRLAHFADILVKRFE